MRPDRDLLCNRPPLPVPGTSRLETIHEDGEGNVLSYDCAYGPGIAMKAGICRQVDADIPFLPPLGPLGHTLIIIPTVGHNKFATDITALSGWEMAIGVGTGAEAAGDTTMSSEITTIRRRPGKRDTNGSDQCHHMDQTMDVHNGGELRC